MDGIVYLITLPPVQWILTSPQKQVGCYNNKMVTLIGIQMSISQLVQYLRICCNYQDFAYRSKLLTTRLLRQGYVYQKLCSTYKTFVHRYPMTLQRYGRCLKNIITECIALPTV